MAAARPCGGTLARRASFNRRPVCPHATRRPIAPPQCRSRRQQSVDSGYVELPGRLRFIMPTLHAQIMADGPRSVGPESSTDVTKIPKTVTKIPKTGRYLLAALEADSLSRAELLGVLGLTDQSANAARHLRPLLDAGLVEMTEPTKPRSKTQRYRITEAGQVALG